METTRHFVATVYVVNDGAVALHRHERLGIRIPPGGHVDRDELPHEAGLREVREETGLDPELVDDTVVGARRPGDAPATASCSTISTSTATARSATSTSTTSSTPGWTPATSTPRRARQTAEVWAWYSAMSYGPK